MIFIDNSNIFRGALTKGIKFDYKKIVEFLSKETIEPYDLVRVIMYCTIDRSQPKTQIELQEKLYKKFNSFPKFDVKIFDLRIINDKKTGVVLDKYEKGVDVALVTDLLLLASRGAFDVAIICAGDGDFYRAVEGIKDMGKEIYVASFDHNCGQKLKEVSLGYISLTQNSVKLI